MEDVEEGDVMEAEIAALSDEELDKRSKEAEAGMSNSPESSTEGEEEASTSPVEKTAQAAAPTPETATPVAETKPVAETPKQEVAPQAQPVPDTQQMTAEQEAQELARREKRIKDKDAFINLLKSEKKAERQRYEAEIAALKSKLTPESFAVEPHKAIEDHARLTQLQNETKRLQDDERKLWAEGLVSKHVDMSPEFLNDAAELLASDGLQDMAIRQFIADPYSATSPEAIIQLGKRVEAVRDAKFLYDLNVKLISEIERLKKAPEQTVQKIEKAFAQGPQVTARSGQGTVGSTKPEYSERELASMSDAQLKEVEKALSI